MIELLAGLIALMVLAHEYYAGREAKTGTACRVWVQEKGSVEWICVE